MTSYRFIASAAACVVCPLSFVPTQAFSHRFVGPRFFPATILADDPFVADEMSLPTFTVNPKGHLLIEGAFR